MFRVRLRKSWVGDGLGMLGPEAYSYCSRAWPGLPWLDVVVGPVVDSMSHARRSHVLSDARRGVDSFRQPHLLITSQSHRNPLSLPCMHRPDC